MGTQLIIAVDVTTDSPKIIIQTPKEEISGIEKAAAVKIVTALGNAKDFPKIEKIVTD